MANKLKPGDRVFFRKSGQKATIEEIHRDGALTIRLDRTRTTITATFPGLSKLGPWDCLCQTLKDRSAGSGCALCQE